MKRLFVFFLSTLAVSQIVGCSMVTRAIDYNIEFRDRQAKYNELRPVTQAELTQAYYGGLSPWWRIPKNEGLIDQNHDFHIDYAAKNLFNDFSGTEAAAMTIYTDCQQPFLKLNTVKLGPVIVPSVLTRYGEPNTLDFSSPESRQKFFNNSRVLAAWYIEPSYGWSGGAAGVSNSHTRGARHGGANPQIMRPDPEHCWGEMDFYACGNINWIKGREISPAPPLETTDMVLYTKGADGYLYAYDKTTEKIQYLHTEGKREDLIESATKACAFEKSSSSWIADMVKKVKSGQSIKSDEPGKPKSTVKQNIENAAF